MTDEREKKEYPELPGQVPEFLKGDEWWECDISPYELDFREQYRPPKFTLSWRGIPFAPLGGIHNITGQSGNGKTMTIAQFMATILKGQVGGLRYELSEEIPQPTLLYIDTEMEKDNTIAVKNRVLTMAGRDIGKAYDDFKVVMLREVADARRPSKDKHGNDTMKTIPAAVMRWRMVLKAIWTYRPTVCFIDGLMDVVADFNDNIECQELIYKCMQVATHYKMSLWCILHQNPGGEKLVGHLGSFVERKVTDVIQTKKEKDKKTGDVTFTVSQKKARSRDIDEWQFVVEPVMGWGVPRQLGDNSEPLTDVKPEQLKQWITERQKDLEWPATHTEFNRAILIPNGVSDATEQKAVLKIAKNCRFVIDQEKDEMTEGQRVPKLKLNSEIILPF